MENDSKMGQFFRTNRKFQNNNNYYYKRSSVVGFLIVRLLHIVSRSTCLWVQLFLFSCCHPNLRGQLLQTHPLNRILSCDHPYSRCVIATFQVKMGKFDHSEEAKTIIQYGRMHKAAIKAATPASSCQSAVGDRSGESLWFSVIFVCIVRRIGFSSVTLWPHMLPTDTSSLIKSVTARNGEISSIFQICKFRHIMSYLEDLYSLKKPRGL